MKGKQPERESRIREAAYFIWENEGRTDGEAKRHWAEAEELVNSVADPQISDPGDSGGARRGRSERFS